MEQVQLEPERRIEIANFFGELLVGAQHRIDQTLHYCTTKDKDAFDSKTAARALQLSQDESYPPLVRDFFRSLRELVEKSQNNAYFTLQKRIVLHDMYCDLQSIKNQYENNDPRIVAAIESIDVKTGRE